VTLTGASDLYDEVTDRVLLQNVSGTQTVTIPPGSTILVIAPANGTVSHVAVRTHINDVIVGYDSSSPDP
jgi:hypothetical protein